MQMFVKCHSVEKQETHRNVKALQIIWMHDISKATAIHLGALSSSQQVPEIIIQEP